MKYGWRASAALSLAWMGFELFILLLRGPHVGRYTWFGYEGGWSARKGVKTKDMGTTDAEKSDDTAPSDTKPKDAETGASLADVTGHHDVTAEQQAIDT